MSGLVDVTTSALFTRVQPQTHHQSTAHVPLARQPHVVQPGRDVLRSVPLRKQRRGARWAVLAQFEERGPSFSTEPLILPNIGPTNVQDSQGDFGLTSHIFPEVSVTAQQKELHARIRKLLPRCSSNSVLATRTSTHPRKRPVKQAFANDSHSAKKRAEARTKGNVSRDEAAAKHCPCSSMSKSLKG